MLKWTSESEYFLSFEKNLQTVQEQSLNPFAAHARRGVIRPSMAVHMTGHEF